MATSSNTSSRRPSLADRLSGTADAVFAGSRPEYRFLYLPLDEIHPNPQNARRHYDAASLEGLAASIRELGVVQPIAVRRLANDGYEIIAGERRYRASRMAERERIPAVVVEHGNHSAMALVENLQREDLNPLEEALGIQHLLTTEELTQSKAAALLGRSDAYVSQMLALLGLDEEIKQAVLEGGVVSKSQLQELLGLDAQRQAELWEMILRGATVRELRQAKQTRSGKPGRRLPYFEQVERRLLRIVRSADQEPEEARLRLAEDLERLKTAIDETLARLRTR